MTWASPVLLICLLLASGGAGTPGAGTPAAGTPGARTATGTGLFSSIASSPVDAPRPSIDRLRWHEALEDVIRHAGDFSTLHVLCAFPEVCLQGGAWPALNRPHTLWNATQPEKQPHLSTEACGRRLSKWDLVLLVAPSNATAIRLVLACKTNDPRYVVAWPYGGADVGRGMMNALGAALSVGRLRVVSMNIPGADTPAAGTDLLFYRVQPYSAQTPCRRRLRPLLVGTWRRGRGFLDAPAPRLFPAGPLRHFQGCPLSVAVRHYPPYASLTRLSKPNAEGDLWELHGKFAPLVRALAHGMHAHFNMSPMPEDVKEGTPLRMTYDLYLSRTLPDPEHRVEVPPTSRGGCYTVCVPRRWRRTPLWRALFAEFSAPVWALVVATFVAMRLALTPVVVSDGVDGSGPRGDRRVQARGADLGFLLLAGVLGSVQASSPGLARPDSRDRFLFAMWLLFSLVMTTAYQAVQHSLRTAPQLIDSLRDLEELARSDVVINGPAVPQVLLALRSAPGGEQLARRYRPYHSGITTMRLSADEAYMCSALERFFLEQKLGRDEAGRPHHVPADSCMVSYYETQIALPVGSFYLHKTSEVVLRLTETGLTQRIIGRRVGNAVLLMTASDTAPGGPHPEDMDQLSPALLLLAAGLGLGAAAFCLELALGRGHLHRPARWLRASWVYVSRSLY